MFKKLLIVLFWATTAAHAATKFSPFTNTLDYTGTTTSTFSANVAFSDTSRYGIYGSTWADSASTGTVGEYKSSQLGVSNCPSSGVWGDACSILLGSGTWIVAGNMTFNGSVNSEAIVAISTVSGNNTAHLRQGVDRFDTASPTAAYDVSQGVPPYMVRNSTPTTYYEKVFCSYVSGTPKYFCTLQGWRAR